MQIIVKLETAQHQRLLPVQFMRQLIRFYGSEMQWLVTGYLMVALNLLTMEQDRFRRAVEGLGGGASDAIDELARQNLEYFRDFLSRFEARRHFRDEDGGRPEYAD